MRHDWHPVLLVQLDQNLPRLLDKQMHIMHGSLFGLLIAQSVFVLHKFQFLAGQINIYLSTLLKFHATLCDLH